MFSPRSLAAVAVLLDAIARREDHGRIVEAGDRLARAALADLHLAPSAVSPLARPAPDPTPA